MIKNRIAIAAGSFLLGTVAPAILASEPVHKACVATVAAGMRAKSRYEDIVEEARAQVADIVLTDSDLQALVTLRRISQGLDRRFDSSFRTILGFNSLLLALGIAGVITPQTSSLLHNGSTVLMGTAAARSYA
jgi:cation transport ATPase